MLKTFFRVQGGKKVRSVKRKSKIDHNFFVTKATDHQKTIFLKSP